MKPAIINTEIKEIKKIYTGKVRDIYEIESGKWLIVATDRISAYDCVFPNGIPDKGMVLNQISNKWFSVIKSIKNHLISTNPETELPFLKNYPSMNERSVIVKKVNRLPVECVVRGYLFGSVYKAYQETGKVCGIELPSGIPLAGKIETPIFTPATKAETGHDENIGQNEFYNVVGKELGYKIISASVEIFNNARDIMEKFGVILADTKFEFGIDENGELILVDEVLTPDSSRYWDASSYKAGESPKSYDKQFVRDYVSKSGWNKQPPAPELPEDIIEKTRDKYMQILNFVQKI